MRRIPNLETAIDECRRNGAKFNWEWCNTAHIKFYIEGVVGCIILSSKKTNCDKVRKELRLRLTGVKG